MLYHCQVKRKSQQYQKNKLKLPSVNGNGKEIGKKSDKAAKNCLLLAILVANNFVWYNGQVHVDIDLNY